MASAGNVSANPPDRRLALPSRPAIFRILLVLTTEDRFVVTHAGSLPRPAALAALHGRRSRGDDVSLAELQATIEAATADVIARQVEVGIDVGNDGEQARESFFTYVQHRMTGFGGRSHRPVIRDLVEHRDYAEMTVGRRERMQVDLLHTPAAIGDVAYASTAELDAESALVADSPFPETFMTAPSPGIVVTAMENRHYPSLTEYVDAVAAALRTEYQAIVGTRAAAADRRTRSGDGAAHAVRRPAARRVPGVRRDGGRGDQPVTRRHRPVASAAARLLGRLRRSAHPRRATRRHPIDAVRSERRRARRVDGQRPPRPRAPLLSSATRCPTGWCSSPG